MTDRFKEALAALTLLECADCLNARKYITEFMKHHGDTIRASLTEAAWHDISTAPKDGTLVMICGGTIEDSLSKGSFKGVTIARYDCVEWEGNRYGSYEDIYIHEPLYWQPLPTPPTAEKGHGDE